MSEISLEFIAEQLKRVLDGQRSERAVTDEMVVRLSRIEHEVKGLGRGLNDVAEDNHMLVKQIRSTHAADKADVLDRVDGIERRLMDVDHRLSDIEGAS